MFRNATGRAALHGVRGAWSGRGAGTALAVLLVLGAAAPASAAEVEFYATVDKEELSINDTLTLSVTIDAGGKEIDEIRYPEAPDFEIISRHQSQQTSFQLSPGGGPPTFKQVRVYRMILSPLRTGTFTIQPGRLSIDGKEIKTGAIRVKVLPAQQQPPPQAQRQPPNSRNIPPNPFGIDDDLLDDPLAQLFGGMGSQPAGDSDLYLRAALDKKKATVGEQVTLSVYLFSRVDVSGVEGLKMPKLDGFWSEDIETPTQISGELRMIDGVPYRVFLLRKRALFPLKSGKLTIEPVEVDVATGFALVLSGRKVHRKSQQLTLEVAPPPDGAPPGFEPSNVGKWKLSASASATTVELGQPLTFTITLEGTGNINGVQVPQLPPVRGLKAYEPTSSDRSSVRRGKVGGRRTLEYLLMPEQTGDFELPALSFTYFDPVAREYRTSKTEPIPIRVEAGAGRPAAAGVAAAHGTTDRAVNVIGADGIRPLRYKGRVVRDAEPLWRTPYFLPVAASPFALWAALGLFGLVRSTVSSTGGTGGARGRAASRARKRLRKSEQLLAQRQPDAFYAEIARAMNDYLADKLRAPVVGLTRADLEAKLTSAGLPAELWQRLSAVLDTCDAGRFAPGATEPDAMQRLHREALEVMEGIEGAKLAPEVSK